MTPSGSMRTIATGVALALGVGAAAWASQPRAADGASPPVGDHQATPLELMLPRGIPLPRELKGTRFETTSVADEAAEREWDQPELLSYVLGGTCLDLGSFSLATLRGEPPADVTYPAWLTQPIVALRFAGADPRLLREAYLQGRRFVGPPPEPMGGPPPLVPPAGSPSFVAAAGWRPSELVTDGRSALRYGADDRHGGVELTVYMVGDMIFEVRSPPALARDIIRLLPNADSRALGPSVEGSDCPGLGDPELRARLPERLGDETLDPLPIPRSMARMLGGLRDVIDPDGPLPTGYLLYVGLGSGAGAIRFDEADRPSARQACAAIHSLIDERCLGQAPVGSGLLLIEVEDRLAGCYESSEGYLFFASRGLGELVSAVLAREPEPLSVSPEELFRMVRPYLEEER